MTKYVPVGRIVGAFGVRGWLKIKSETDPADNILKYSPWIVEIPGQILEYRILDGKRQGPSVVARLEGVTDRDQAQALQGATISVARHLFPPLKRGEFYWADLIGLEVRAVTGLGLGTLVAMMETGANDVMEVHGERVRMIPFILGQYVQSVDLEAGLVIVDWDPDF